MAATEAPEESPRSRDVRRAGIKPGLTVMTHTQREGERERDVLCALSATSSSPLVCTQFQALGICLELEDAQVMQFAQLLLSDFFCRFILPHHFVSQILPFYNFRAWTLFSDQSCLKLTQAPYHHDVFCCTIQTAPASHIHSLTHMKEGIQSESILCFGILTALQQRHSNTRLL